MFTLFGSLDKMYKTNLQFVKNTKSFGNYGLVAIDSGRLMS